MYFCKQKPTANHFHATSFLLCPCLWPCSKTGKFGAAAVGLTPVTALKWPSTCEERHCRLNFETCFETCFFFFCQILQTDYISANRKVVNCCNVLFHKIWLYSLQNLSTKMHHSLCWSISISSTLTKLVSKLKLDPRTFRKKKNQPRSNSKSPREWLGGSFSSSLTAAAWLLLRTSPQKIQVQSNLSLTGKVTLCLGIWKD